VILLWIFFNFFLILDNGENFGEIWGFCVNLTNFAKIFEKNHLFNDTNYSKFYKLLGLKIIKSPPCNPPHQELFQVPRACQSFLVIFKFDFIKFSITKIFKTQ
jgi:hypothetical protein